MRRRFPLSLAMICLALAGVAVWYLWPASPPAWADDYDVTARPPETIPPGTVIGTTPDGWSHLVIKSLPRVRPGDEQKVPPIARSQTIEMTRWMFAAFVADVRPDTRGSETRHHLRAVAVLGLGTSVNGRDVVITPETAAAPASNSIGSPERFSRRGTKRRSSRWSWFTGRRSPWSIRRCGIAAAMRTG